jgi:hypothetical protein
MKKQSSARVLVMRESPNLRARLLDIATTKLWVFKLMIHRLQLTIYNYFRLISWRFELLMSLPIIFFHS